MQHLTILPILVPLLAGILLILPPLSGGTIVRQRAFSVAATLLLLLISILLLMKSTQTPAELYVLGDWQPPFGIVLMLDRLSAMMVLLTSFLGLCALLYACGGDDKGGSYFHPLFMFQLMGINGAFLTGDIFNLFVFFEILLLASYALLIHGGGKFKTRAAFHYITLNLLGSSVFLVALGVIYGTLGTLNMADMSVKVSLLPDAEQTIVKVGALMLLLVFGLKSAMLPLQFWLPATYSSACAPVAALFAILTKVGLYSILRVFTLIFGDQAGDLANIALPWLWPISILTMVMAIIGIFAAETLRQLVSQLTILSVGTLLSAFAVMNTMSISGALYYLVHSTLACAALFLIADMIIKQRGKAEDRFVPARRMLQSRLLSLCFFTAAIAIIGLPPLSGAVGKALVLMGAETSLQMSLIWPAVIIGGLAALIALTRAGTTLFWRVSADRSGIDKAQPVQVTAVVLLLLCSPLMVVLGGPITEFLSATAEQVHSMPSQISDLFSLATEAP